jgi:hypothetical protein
MGDPRSDWHTNTTWISLQKPADLWIFQFASQRDWYILSPSSAAPLGSFFFCTRGKISQVTGLAYNQKDAEILSSTTNLFPTSLNSQSRLSRSWQDWHKVRNIKALHLTQIVHQIAPPPHRVLLNWAPSKPQP